MELYIKIINGKFNLYAEVGCPKGYCFYDIDIEERNYINNIATPIINPEELRRKFVLVEGDADELNEQLQNEISR